jgi:hypothetical protein
VPKPKPVPELKPKPTPKPTIKPMKPTKVEVYEFDSDEWDPKPTPKKFPDATPETKKWVESLSLDDVTEVLDYTIGGEETSITLEGIIAKAPKVSGVVYRGGTSRVIKGVEAGQSFKFGQMTSTSRNRFVAEEFTARAADLDRQPVLFRIQTRSAVDIRSLSAYGNQQEFLVQGETKFKVLSVKPHTIRGQAGSIVELEEL